MEKKPVKVEAKKGKRLCSKRVKHVSKALVGLVALAMMAYGMVYIPAKQLSLQEDVQQLALIKDDRTCKAVSSQQLQAAVAGAEKNKQSVSKENANIFFENAYNNCMFLSGRLAELPAAKKLVAPAQQNQKPAPKAETKKEDKK